jgi:hypothetical protein
MPLNFADMPLAELEALLSVVSGKTKFTWEMIPQALRVISWAYECLRGRDPLAIGTVDPGSITDEEALQALISGTATDETVAGGGVLASAALAIALKIAVKLLSGLLS